MTTPAAPGEVDGLLDELAGDLGALDPSVDHDLDAALALAQAEFEATSGAPVGVELEVAGARHVVTAGETLVVGRQGDAVVDAPLVSRRHVAVTVDVALAEMSVTCRDLGSANGSWRRRGAGRAAIGDAGVDLAPGDVVETASGVELLRVVGGV